MPTLLSFLLASLATIASPAADGQTTKPGESLCPAARSQMEMNQCMAAAYDAADKDLNRFYSGLTSRLESEAVAKLQTAQRAWIKYRDVNCDAEASLYDGGSIAPATRSACLERNTRERIAELHRIYDTGTR